jgi:hypothetical protein
LDRASSLGLTADQIIFLQTVYKTSLEEISGSTQSVYVVDSQGRATFENQDLEKYKRAFASEEEKIKALNDDRSHGSRAARPPSTQRAPATRPAKVGQPRKPHLRTQEIYYDHFFCKRCITPFEAPKGKQKILCPCCGGEIGRSSKIT